MLLAAIGTAFNDIPDVTRTIARASGGNRSVIASLAGNINASTKQAARHDLAGSFGELQELSQREAGLGTSNAAVSYDTAATQAWQSASLYQHANDKPQNINAAIAHHTRMLNQGMATGDQGQLERAAVFFNELKAMAPNANGAVKASIDTALTNNAAAISAAVTALPVTPSNPSTDKAVVRETQVRDPATGNYTRQTEQVRSREETASERIERLSRTYERVDPNRLDN